ncbi:protein artichoke [Vespula squamosa]|uniref:Protein artichoke n=2 Tax=Vespula squamosa TaxID=30214 RepID=A0ABD2C961_VESSQ
MQPPTNHPPTISTYLIFNQLRIIHPQFRPKSRYLVLTIVIEYSMVVVRARSKEEAVCRRGPHKLWLKRATIRLLSYFRRFNRNLRESLLKLRRCNIPSPIPLSRITGIEHFPTVDYVLPSEICEARPVVLSSSGD